MRDWSRRSISWHTLILRLRLSYISLAQRVVHLRGRSRTNREGKRARERDTTGRGHRKKGEVLSTVAAYYSPTGGHA
jgi:hypothetical protein